MLAIEGCPQLHLVDLSGDRFAFPVEVREGVVITLLLGELRQLEEILGILREISQGYDDAAQSLELSERSR